MTDQERLSGAESAESAGGALAAVGVDGAAERVFRAMLRTVGARPAELAAAAGVDGAGTAAALAVLEQYGLAARGSDGERWTAVPPGVALGALLRRRHHELQLAEAAADRLAAEYRRHAPGRADADTVEVVVGRKAVADRFLQIQLGAEREVRSLVRSDTHAVTSAENTAEDSAVARGVRYRVVLEREEFESGRSDAALRQIAEQARTLRLPDGTPQREVRVSERLPGKLVIADGQVALVPLTVAGETVEPAALVVRAPGMLDLLSGVFDAAWRQAWPVGFDPVGEELGTAGPSEVDRQILRLLLSGMTDAVVARQVGLSQRTVQRRVRVLMAAAGVSTRLQLGWVARERGW